MRLTFLLLIFLVSCNSPEANIQDNETQSIDSVLEQSQKSFVTADSVGKQSDEFINTKVTKTVKQITTLKEEVKTLKEENNVLKVKLDSVDDVGKPFSLLPVSNDQNPW